MWAWGAVCLGVVFCAAPAMAGYENNPGNMPWVAATQWKDSRVESNGYSITASDLRYRILPPRRRSKGTQIGRGEHVTVLYKLFLSTETEEGVDARPAGGKHTTPKPTAWIMRCAPLRWITRM